MVGEGGGGGGFADRRFLPSGACICAYQMGQVSGCSEFLSVSGQGFASVRYQTRNQATNQPTTRETWRNATKGKGMLLFDRSGLLALVESDLI